MKLICVLLITVCLVGAVPQFHRVKTFYKSEHVVQDAIFDEEEQYSMIFTPGSVSKSRPSINFHDLATGYSAIKDIEEGVCYLDISNHTMEDFKARVLSIQTEKVHDDAEFYSWNCAKTPMPSAMVSKVAGERIGMFCNEYNTMLVERMPEEYVSRAKRVIDQKQEEESNFWCLLCIIARCTDVRNEKQELLSHELDSKEPTLG